MGQVRLDVLLVERGLCKSREEAQALILAGEIWSGETRLEKAGTKVSAELPLEVRSRLSRYVSRAGDKLQKALESFEVDPRGRICLDIGASTGGFTDCLLQAGAGHVLAVDVGYGQLDKRLRDDERVTVLERTNARYVTREFLEDATPLARQISLVVIDVSFISASKVLLPLSAAVGAADWIVLFKPQFEVGPENLGKGGVVRNAAAADSALQSLHEHAKSVGLALARDPESSPLPGKKSGNVETLVHYVRTSPPSQTR